MHIENDSHEIIYSITNCLNKWQFSKYQSKKILEILRRNEGIKPLLHWIVPPRNNKCSLSTCNEDPSTNCNLNTNMDFSYNVEHESWMVNMKLIIVTKINTKLESHVFEPCDIQYEKKCRGHIIVSTFMSHSQISNML